MRERTLPSADAPAKCAQLGLGQAKDTSPEINASLQLREEGLRCLSHHRLSSTVLINRELESEMGLRLKLRHSCMGHPKWCVKHCGRHSVFETN